MATQRALKAGGYVCGWRRAALVVVEGIPRDLPALMGTVWEIGVLYGPQGAPEFFTKDDIAIAFRGGVWKVHFNSARTGVRLIGPRPQWARTDGGEAGLHPSNIHDNAYAVGAIDFTGDMPIILGPDGPSLGGFVCPAVVASGTLETRPVEARRQACVSGP